MSLFTRNWRLKLVAVFFASTTWVVVAYAGNPVVSRDIPKVAVQVGPPPNNWVLVGQPPPVTVTVSGLQQSLNAFRPDSLHVSVDLDGAKLGPNVVRVRVDNADSRVTVAQVQPASVGVVLDERATVTKKIDVKYTGQVNQCCDAGTYQAVPDSVRITGPKSLLGNAQPQVFVDLTGAATEVKVVADVKLANIDSRAAPLVAVDPPQVQITVPVTNHTVSASKGISVVDVGELAAGYHISDIKVSPQIVVVTGDPSIVGSITAVNTAPINVNGASSDVVQTVSLRPPNGVSVAGSTQVTVHIFITRDSLVQPSPAPTPSPSP